ncbi:MAG TPA: sporulation transcription factor Spo0A [Clostridiales bacterium]|nr:sporulation transcription factor Spo0A [Clostridiales bacterium]HPV02119.1 sporulation transcription factor Spo0A [Clostridiales bacterium]
MMTDRVSVLIVDDNRELCGLLTESINSTDDMQVVAATGDGMAAMDMIRELEPDVVLLDIILPKLDGLAVLERIASQESGKKPVIIVSTTVGSESIIKRAMELGADFYILKPFDVNVLITRIRQVWSDIRSSDCCSVNPDGSVEHGHAPAESDNVARPAVTDAVQVVTELIRSIGVTPNLSGFNYLREAVLLGMEQPARLDNVSRNIFTVLAQKYNTKVRNIDRAIRCALISAQNKTKNPDGLLQMMQESIMIHNGRRPNNSQVIAFLAKKAGMRLADMRARNGRLH